MFYFNWLQKGNFTGVSDRFPVLKNRFETTVPGVYCIGDLTGVPLVKMAAESGHELVEKLVNDGSFAKLRQSVSDDTYELLIAGAGPAGIAASMRASELNVRHLVVESSRLFSTIHNYPSGKPIYVTPPEPPMKSALSFSDGTKETLLDDLAEDIKGKSLPVNEGETVKSITKRGNVFEVTTSAGTYKALRVIIAIGKSGNARKLNVPGEDLPNVFTRLIDPGEFSKKDIVVVGGGDSAVEAAVALADSGNRVALSYRKESLNRPKESNVRALEQRIRNGSVTTLLQSQVKEIRPEQVLLGTSEGETELRSDAVFVLIGTEIPIQFFKRSGIAMEGEKKPSDWVKIAAMLLFSMVLYFGKKAPVTRISGADGFFDVPSMLFTRNWPAMVNGLAAWGSFIGLAVFSVFLVAHFLQHRKKYFTNTWNTFKYSYFFVNLVLFSWLYVSYKLFNTRPVYGDMGIWYTLFYSVTIVVFGWRRITVNPTGYIKRQTLLLMAIQVIPLFILPVFVIPSLARNGLLSEWVMTNVFPAGSYWRAYGLVLAWPLFIHNLATNQPTAFWLWTGIIQSFVIIPLIIYKWGKGSYCGWICSCGALAETLGDEYRMKTPHGPVAKKWDNAGQVVLWLAAVVTILILTARYGSEPLSAFSLSLYSVLVDIFFAGVIGVGLYFVMSGRIWCRFLCPLAALMNIYTRFSRYRIFSNKKRCISCNICTKVCHMGIDVMGYANKGIPMDDVQCVRCSACVVNCPMQVLTFGSVDKIDMENKRYKEKKFALARGWASGLLKRDIEMLVEAEEKERSRGGKEEVKEGVKEGVKE